MSYRFRFASAKRENVLHLRNMTYEELVNYYKKNKPNLYNDCEDVEQLEAYEMFEQTELYDFAQLSFLPKVMKTAEKLFTNPDTDKMFEHYNLYLCRKESFLTAIECMREMIVENFKEMLDLPYEHLQLKVRNKMEEWQLFSEKLNIEDATKYAKLNEQTKPYNTDIEDEKIVNSWLYEYSIFELVRLFKKFDWENDVLLLYGW